MARPSNTSRFSFAGLILVVAVAILAGGCSRDQAEEQAKKAKEEADRLAREADRLTKEWAPVLLDAAKEAKTELDKVAPTKTEYELVFAAPEEGSEKVSAHEARLKKMNRVEIQGATVGYEQCEECSLGGKSFTRHFRATWITHGKVIGVSYYSMQSIDAVAFVDLLKRLVPITNEVFQHVQLKRGE